MIRRRAALLALPALAVARAADDHVTFDEPSGVSPGPMRVFIHRPAAWTAGRPVVLVMHGVRRDAARYRDTWAGLGDRYSALIACPELTEARFPGARWYNEGGISAAPDGPWSFGVPGRAFAALRARFGAAAPGFHLYGHSAGAQFVHRALLFDGLVDARGIVAANAGWYTLPVADVAFPYGLGGTRLGDAALRARFAAPFTLLLGEADIDPRHPALRRTEQADAQGVTRFARGQHFFALAQARAAALGAPFAWRLGTVPGVGHSDAGMSGPAAARLLGPSP